MGEFRIEETSAMSERPVVLHPKSFRRDLLFGWSTLSSLALPILENGSSCSRSMLKRAERLGMIRLVRKSSPVGSSAGILISGFASGRGFLLFFHRLVADFLRLGEICEGLVKEASAASLELLVLSGAGSAARFLRNLFMVRLSLSMSVRVRGEVARQGEV